VVKRPERNRQKTIASWKDAGQICANTQLNPQCLRRKSIIWAAVLRPCGAQGCGGTHTGGFTAG
jgi:hypothetical protein